MVKRMEVEVGVNPILRVSLELVQVEPLSEEPVCELSEVCGELLDQLEILAHKAHLKLLERQIKVRGSE